jgi:hypothetical protein
MPIYTYLGDGISARAWVDSLDTPPPARATIDQLVELSTKVVVVEHDKETYTRSKCAQPLDGESKTKGASKALSDSQI